MSQIRRKRTIGDVEREELINGAVNELDRFFEELRLEGEKSGNDIGDLEQEFGNLIVTASNNDENIEKVTDTIASRVKARKDRKPKLPFSAGRKQRGL